jgi:hypothetical protein
MVKELAAFDVKSFDKLEDDAQALALICAPQLAQCLSGSFRLDWGYARPSPWRRR